MASFVDTEQEKIVAYLHDVMEDHPDYMSVAAFRERFGDTVTDALLLLRHDRDDSYTEYIDKIRNSDNRLAIRVKIADLRHNMDVSRGREGTDVLPSGIPAFDGTSPENGRGARRDGRVRVHFSQKHRRTVTKDLQNGANRGILKSIFQTPIDRGSLQWLRQLAVVVL